MTRENHEQSHDIRELLQMRREKLLQLQSDGADPFQQTRWVRTCTASEIKENFEALDGAEVSICGRQMSKRDMGKAFFCDVLDQTGRIQAYVKSDDLGQQAFKDFKRLDIGDILGAKGIVFKTRRGEISVHVSEVVLLSKSLRPLPEKFHGLQDQEIRYRQRYLDLIVNPEVQKVFAARAKMLKKIREFLDSRDYLEVDTPVLNTVSGGANARPFITRHNTLGLDMYLRIATELPLKRLLVGGLERVYEIGRLFRNEGMDKSHNPEFTTIEYYQAYADCNDMMDLTESMILFLCSEVCNGIKLSWQDTVIDMAAPWKRITMADAVKEVTGIDFTLIDNDVTAAKQAKAADVHIKDGVSQGEILFACFDQKVEHTLISPTFVTRHPVEVSPLAKRCADDPRFTDRFELFVGGKELANGFSELNDPIDQRMRFERQALLREKGDQEAQMIDEDFLLALEHGMPPAGGVGVGIDRLCMLLTNNSSIRDVLLFPTMKPENAQ
ncbi:MAG: lysine--tRNA ligase [Oscillospiraceae bacterium]|nr:lysine--tRNA ligase [Oscillospiraceae bacterium]